MINKPVTLSKRFSRNFRKRIAKDNFLLEQYQKCFALFLTNKNFPFLRDHPLKGTLKGYRAFAITGDIRVVYLDMKDQYLFVDIGTHDQVYRKP